MTNNEQRYKQFCAWIANQVPYTTIVPIKGDASFRRYYRVQTLNNSVIAVDAPPHTENNQAFVNVAEGFLQMGLQVPEVLHTEFDQGFLLLSDLGDTQLLSVLNDQNVDFYYQKSVMNLIKLQSCRNFKNKLPIFDHALLLEELTRFPEWYLIKYMGLSLSYKERCLFDEIFNLLISSALEQPSVCVHRDYHSRNIMLLEGEELGILDFQDAVWGPLTYDLVSLLRDCYTDWPSERIDDWINQYRHHFQLQVKVDTFIKWFDWMGLQRHLKVLGIFARLYIRDEKSNYLRYIPKILHYILAVCERYPEFTAFQSFLINRVLPNESNDISCRQRETTTSINGSDTKTAIKD